MTDPDDRADGEVDDAPHPLDLVPSDEAEYERLTQHPWFQFLGELAYGMMEAAERPNAAVSVVVTDMDLGEEWYLTMDEAKERRLYSWLEAERRRGTGSRKSTTLVPRPTRSQWAASVARRRTSRPALKRTSRS
jgi:hypothetical protein